MVKFFKPKPTHNKNFGWAIKAMREGVKVSRKFWGDLYLYMRKEDGHWNLYLCNVHDRSYRLLGNVLADDVLAEDWGEYSPHKTYKETRIWPTTISNSNRTRKGSKASSRTA